MKDKTDKRMERGLTVLYLLLTVGVGLAILIALINIQFVHGSEWRSRGEKREAGIRTDHARRGNIYSSDGKILATTVTKCDLYLDLMDTVVLENGSPKIEKGVVVESGPITDSAFNRYIDTISLMLNDALPSHSAAYYRERIATERAKEKPRRCFLVQRGVPYSVWLQISRLPGWSRGVVKQVDGQSVVHQVRAHIYGNMAENTIGFSNSKSDGTYTGLEGYYDSILRGQDGQFHCRRLTAGIWLPDEPRARGQIAQRQRTDTTKIDTLILQRRIDGQSIVSTIDTRYQDIAESALRNALRSYGGSSGCAMLMEMKTGYILACVNLAVDTSVHDYREVRDRNVAVSDVYEPGSTFKTVVLTAMMNDPKISIDTSMRVRANYKNFGGKYGEIHDDHNAGDTLSVKQVIEQSSNVGMCDLGWMYYNTRRDSLRQLVQEIFPYGKISPDVKAPESRTYINELRNSNRDFLNFCYGYSTRVSPLQLLTFYNALGNDGRMVKPLFCRAVIDRSGTRREVRPVVLNPRICSRRTVAVVHDMLEGVVENGTGSNIKNTTYGIAGKTGTSVFNYSNMRRYNASFAGFFPSEEPRYTCLVVLRNIPVYGRQAALVFKSISDCVVAVDKGLSDGAVRSVRPRLEEDSSRALQRPTLLRGREKDISDLYHRLKIPYSVADSVGTWVVYRSATDSTAAHYVNYRPAEGRIPNCIGMSAKDAVALLHSFGYRVSLNGYGKVSSQSPKPNQAGRKGTIVNIFLK